VQLLVGAKLKDKRRDTWLASLAPRLHPGEQVLALVPNNLLRPLCNGLAVTNARILAFYSAEVEHNGPKLEVSASDLTRVEINIRHGICYLVAHRRRDGGELVLASVHKQDATMVRQTAEQLVMTSTPSDGKTATVAHAAQESARPDRWNQVEVGGDTPDEKAWPRASTAEAEPPTVRLPASNQSSLIDDLSKLAFLHRQGVLTDAEFAAAKQVAMDRQANT
jgi:hypothetical protein